MQAFEILLLDALQHRSSETVMLRCADENGEAYICDIETALEKGLSFTALENGDNIDSVAARVFALIERENR